MFPFDLVRQAHVEQTPCIGGAGRRVGQDQHRAIGGATGALGVFGQLLPAQRALQRRRRGDMTDEERQDIHLKKQELDPDSKPPETSEDDDPFA